MNVARTLKRFGLLGIIFGTLMSSQGGPVKSQPAGTAKSAAAPKVNRIAPKVEPPKGGLQFSAKPTVDEIFRARIFAEPLVPIGGTPDTSENAALATALSAYSKRSGPDDFSSLNGFLNSHPQSAWSAALLTDLGLEYYNTSHYSLALDAWKKAWELSKDATDLKSKAIADRAVGELAYMYARLGRMEDLEPLFNSVGGRVFTGPASERISGARAGLSNMKDRPEIAFRCGPLALHSIKLMNGPKNAGTSEIIKSASTQKGFSLPQVAGLSRKVDLNYQMAFRENGGAIVVPSVVHWKVGHYAAIVRQEGDRYLVKDPTFQNDVWATPAAIEEEASGYFLVASGELPHGWRPVSAQEGGKVWGRGNVCCRDPNGPPGPPPPPCNGMAVSTVDLMRVSSTIEDAPVGYRSPVGPAINFVVIYQQREANQPAGFNYSSFGPKWTFGWLSYITDNPQSPSADVKDYLPGGGTRTFTGFNAATQTFAYQQYGQDKLVRTSPSSYELTSPDGSKKVFGLSDGSTGTTRRVFLTQLIDRFGNTVTLTYDSFFRIVAVTDAIGQVSTLTYANSSDFYKITKITDPFGRFATFDYDSLGRLIKITDVIGIQSQFGYDTTSDFINTLTTPYGVTSFSKGEVGTTAWLETTYPTGEKDRVEFNQSTNLGVPQSLPTNQLPAGMNVHNDYMSYRNTFYWSKNAYASSYPDYTKARIYHWCHTADGASASAIVESEKAPLEGRVWYDYAGQSDSIFVGTTDRPTHIGRVLDDGTTQLYTYEYDGFGHVTKAIDPVGRTSTYVYAANGIDLLEMRQAHGGVNERLSLRTFNAQHRPLTETDAAGQTSTYTYNARGQLLTRTNAKNETTTYSYDPNGYLLTVDGPLAGTADSINYTYDGFGRVRTHTDEIGYTRTFDYDALDRRTKTTFPDQSFNQLTYTNLDVTQFRDRAGRNTFFEYTPLRQMSKRTDPLNRVTRWEWCKCGGMKSMTDPMGRTTAWEYDVQDRLAAKVYPDGTKESYFYENTSSRLRERVDERSQVTRYSYERDNNLKSISYPNAAVATPSVTFTYDTTYKRVSSMTDGSGTTRYSYNPIGSPPILGAGALASIDGPLPNDTITYSYDALRRPVGKTVGGEPWQATLDPLGRATGITNSLGSFTFTYDGPSGRLLSAGYPNGQTWSLAYEANSNDRRLNRITHTRASTALSEFLYTHDSTRNRLTSWSQQAGTASPINYALGYDAADELTSATGSQNAAVVKNFAYSYDPGENRLSEQVDGGVARPASFNALNEVTSLNNNPVTATSYEWDAEQRLAAINIGNLRTEFSYDGLGRRVGIRELNNSVETSNRRFVWCDGLIWEERTAAGSVVKRFFPEGVKVESGASPGSYFYTKDHLGSIRELVDGSGVVRARYDYEPYGARTKVSGDLDADMGYTGHLTHAASGLYLSWYRAYDPRLGRWLSRDLHADNEFLASNLYTYAFNNPVNFFDPDGRTAHRAAGGGAPATSNSQKPKQPAGKQGTVTQGPGAPPADPTVVGPGTPPADPTLNGPGTPNGGFPGTPNGGFPGTPNGGFPGTPNGGFPGTPNGGFPGTPNGGFPGTPNGGFPGTPNGGFPGTPPSDQPNGGAPGTPPADPGSGPPGTPPADPSTGPPGPPDPGPEPPDPPPPDPPEPPEPPKPPEPPNCEK